MMHQAHTPECARRRRALLLIGALLAFACTVPAAPALAQRATDVVALARTMKEAGETATRVATELRRVHAQDAAATARALWTVGYAATATAAALKEEFALSGVDAFYTMRDQGYATTTVLDALNANGMRVRLDCIEPQRTPVPCGPFGGNRAQPAMNQVTWSPYDQGYTDSTLTITGTGIPPVDVRIGATVLTLLENTATVVRARLPAAPVTGPLTLRRTSDGVVGELVSSFAVSDVSATAPPNWPLFGQIALAAAIEDARHWLSAARIAADRCTVEGGLASGALGVLSSATGFEDRVKNALLAAGAPAAIAQAWDGAFQAAWTEWSGKAMIPALPWYPAFAAFPDSVAPPMPNLPVPLGALISPGLTAMAPHALAGGIRTATGVAADAGPAAQAIDAFSTALSTRFTVFLTVGMVMNVMGSGPVPSFAPPLVPVGPVSGGTCSGTHVLANWTAF
jgi:hypothetical protein